MVKKKRKLIAWTVSMGVAGVLIGLALPKVRSANVLKTANQYEPEFAAAKREGAVITPDELLRTYGRKSGRNAGPLILAIPTPNRMYAYIRADSKEVLEYNTSRVPPPNELVRGAHETVDKLGPLKDYLSASCCDLESRWEPGWGFEMQGLTQANILCSALAVLADDAAFHRDRAACLNYLVAIRRTAELLGGKPSMQALLVQVGLYALLHRAVAEIALQQEETSMLVALKEIINTPITIDIRPVVEYEMVLNWASVQDPLRCAMVFPHAESTPEVIELQRNDSVPGMHLAWKTRCLSYVRRVRVSLDTHGSDWRAFTADMKLEQATLQANLKGSERVTYAAQAIFQPDLEGLCSQWLGPETTRRMALELVNSCLDDDKAPVLPVSPPQTDPFTGTTFKYLVNNGKDYLVSAGPDGKFAEEKQPLSTGTDDIHMAIRKASRSTIAPSGD